MFRERNTQKLTEADRGAIISLLNDGKSVTYVANSLGFAEKTVRLWQRRFNDTQNVKRAKGSGRPKSTTPAEDRKLVAAVRAKPITTAQELAGSIICNT